MNKAKPSMLKFQCIEDPVYLYEANKQLIDELYGNYDNFLKESRKHSNSNDF